MEAPAGRGDVAEEDQENIQHLRRGPVKNQKWRSISRPRLFRVLGWHGGPPSWSETATRSVGGMTMTGRATWTAKREQAESDHALEARSTPVCVARASMKNKQQNEFTFVAAKHMRPRRRRHRVRSQGAAGPRAGRRGAAAGAFSSRRPAPCRARPARAAPAGTPWEESAGSGGLNPTDTDCHKKLPSSSSRGQRRLPSSVAADRLKGRCAFSATFCTLPRDATEGDAVPSLLRPCHWQLA